MLRFEYTYSKRSWVIGGISIVAVVGALFSLVPSRTKVYSPVTPEKISYSYEMPRGETMEIPFDLTGRRVVRKYPNAPAQAAPVPFVQQKVAPVVAKGTTGTAFPQVKKETAKEKAARVAKGKKAATAAKKNHKVQVVSASDRFKMKSDPPVQKPSAAPSYTYYPAAPAQQQQVADDPVVDKPDDDVIDPSTWQSMLQNKPDASTIAKFMKARNEGKIADGAFYRIVTVLLQDNAVDRRKAALLVLDQDSSPRTYEYIVMGAATNPNPDVQAQMRTLQARYTTPSKIFLLGRVLAATTNKTVLLAALLQLNQAAQTQGPIPAPGQPTGQSAGIHAQLNSMLPVLRKVATNPDPAVADQAKALLSALQKV